MAEISTYLTATELTYRFPGDTDTGYSSAEKADALAESFRLVNDHVNHRVAVPVSNPSGVVRQAQAMFYRYILQMSHTGITDEVTALYDHAVELLQGPLTALAATDTFPHDTGWYVVSVQPADGVVHVKGAPPGYLQEWRLLFTSANDSYAGDATFTAYTADDSEAQLTGLAPADGQWIDVYDTEGTTIFSVLLTGKFDLNEEVTILGVSADAANKASPSNAIQQGRIAY